MTDVNRNVNIPQLISAIGYEYLRTHATELNDEGQDLLQKQRGFQLINPTEKWFPGLMELRETFASWDWRFGKTPKFTVQKDIQLKSTDKDSSFQLKMEVEKVTLKVLHLRFEILIILNFTGFDWRYCHCYA